MLFLNMITTVPAIADGDSMIECPNSHAHVWHREQCENTVAPGSFPGGGGGPRQGGLLGLVHSLTGGLL